MSTRTRARWAPLTSCCHSLRDAPSEQSGHTGSSWRLFASSRLARRRDAPPHANGGLAGLSLFCLSPRLTMKEDSLSFSLKQRLLFVLVMSIYSICCSTVLEPYLIFQSFFIFDSISCVIVTSRLFLFLILGGVRTDRLMDGGMGC